MVRHFHRLMPLLLEWMHAPDLETRLAAVKVLRTVLTRTWPRLPAHASLIWQHVTSEYKLEARHAEAAGTSMILNSPLALASSLITAP